MILIVGYSQESQALRGKTGQSHYSSHGTQFFSLFVESEIYKGHICISPAPWSWGHGTHVPPLLLM